VKPVRAALLNEIRAEAVVHGRVVFSSGAAAGY
jgi:hypothetical protein